MKKICYFLVLALLTSCTNTDASLEDTESPAGQEIV